MDENCRETMRKWTAAGSEDEKKSDGNGAKTSMVCGEKDVFAGENAALRITCENYRIVNNSLREKVAELAGKLKSCESIFERFDQQFALIFEGGAVNGLAVIHAEKLRELEDAAEEFRKLQAEEIRTDVEAVQRLQDRDAEIQSCREQIARLKSVSEKQQTDGETLANANQKVVDDMHTHFAAYVEFATKEADYLKQALESQRLENSREVAQLKGECKRLTAENEAAKAKLEDMEPVIRELRAEIGHRVKMYEEERKSRPEQIGKVVSTVEGGEEKVKAIEHSSALLEQVRAELAGKNEQFATLEAQIRTKEETFRKEKADLESQRDELKIRETVLLKRMGTLENTLKVSLGGTVQASSAVGEEGLQMEKMRGELLRLRMENERLSGENAKLAEEQQRFSQELSVPICHDSPGRNAGRL